jgi:predicted amidohydrolase
MALRVALLQMRSETDPAGNLATLERLVTDAAAAGAAYVQSPEMTNILTRDREALLAAVRPESDDPFVSLGASLARRHGIVLHLGSLALRRDDGRTANRALVFGPDGAILGRYDKIHMFDVDLESGDSWRESATYVAGDDAVLVETGAFRLGLAICYDLRFPGLFRAYAEAGAGLLTAPAAFTRETGEAHWQVLQRARAIENGAYMLSAAQGGRHQDGRTTYGHSIVVDPWGRVVAEAAGDEPGVVMAEIELSAVAEVRNRIPALRNGRRFSLERPA